ncbi:MAG: isoprenylcysteine carboxylmethyltransferase family protein [Anaerolineales bacterium]|nr:isoprenylcysteine carboxylmethyltransferase family protein [Anaerolineales bacterium]
MVYLIAWILFTILLLVFTLIRPHPYRFTRFMAFESILGLIFLNAESWFVDPFSCIQIISWIFLAGSMFLAAHGFSLIKIKGNPTGDFEDTTSLITTGAYRFIRHPLYGSLLLFGVGGFLKRPTLLGTGLMGTLFLGVFLTAQIEEKHNLERFGEEYLEYSEKTKRFIPYIY